jgi:hypothetical protein
VEAQGLVGAVSQALATILTEVLGRKVHVDGEISVSILFLLDFREDLEIFLVHVRFGKGVED